MKKKVISIVLILVVAGLAFYINNLLPIITGYSAKNMASDVFVGNRLQQQVEDVDLNFSFLRFVHNRVDYSKREVESRFLWYKSKALFVDGFGCVLLRDEDEGVLKKRFSVPVKRPVIYKPSDKWPLGNRLADTLPVGLNRRALDSVVRVYMDDSPGRKGTFAVAVACHNQLVVEKYHRGFSSANRYLSWSMAKSITNALVGIMVANRKMDVHQAALLPQWKPDARASIQLKDLMHMNSGLEWNEDYGNASDVNLMLHEQKDMAAYAALRPLIHKPGRIWAYSSGSTNIVSCLIRRQFKTDQEYWSFPYAALFAVVGMNSAVFEPDLSGTFVGSSYLYASLRDYVRFGLLYLNDGCVADKRILPAGWVKFSVDPAPGSSGRYGAFFWLNRSGEYPSAPRDMFMCKGHDGQYIFIIPSLSLVVVRLGYSKKEDFDAERFIAGIVAAVRRK